MDDGISPENLLLGRMSEGDLNDGVILRFTNLNMNMNYKKQKRTWKQREEVTKRNQVHLLQNAERVDL